MWLGHSLYQSRCSSARAMRFNCRMRNVATARVMKMRIMCIMLICRLRPRGCTTMLLLCSSASLCDAMFFYVLRFHLFSYNMYLVWPKMPHTVHIDTASLLSYSVV